MKLDFPLPVAETPFEKAGWAYVEVFIRRIAKRMRADRAFIIVKIRFPKSAQYGNI